MAESRGRDNWHHTSALMALTFNVNRGSKDKAAKPSDFNPYTPAAKPIKVPLSTILDMFKKP